MSRPKFIQYGGYFLFLIALIFSITFYIQNKIIVNHLKTEEGQIETLLMQKHSLQKEVEDLSLRIDKLKSQDDPRAKSIKKFID